MTNGEISSIQIAANLESIEDCQREFKTQLEAADEMKEKIEQDQKVYDSLKEKHDESARRIAEDKVEETLKEVRNKINRFVTS